MNPFDIGALVIIGLFILRAAFIGFVAEISQLAWLLLAGVASWLFSGLLGNVFVPYFGEGIHNQLIAIGIITILSIILVKLLFTPIRSILENLDLQAIDHIIGAVVGLFEGIVVVFLLFLLIGVQQVWPIHELLGQSVTSQVLSPFVPWVQSTIKEVLPHV